jgi:anti-anti-sigma factor
MAAGSGTGAGRGSRGAVAPVRLRAPWDGHQLLLHDGDDERLLRSSAWVRRGLELGERVVHAGGGEGRALLGVLDRQGIDTDAAAASGRLLSVDAERLADSGERRRLIEQALVAGYPRIRLEAPQAADWSSADLLFREMELQELCRSGRVSVLCHCERSRALGALLRPAVAAHADGVRTRILTCRRIPGGLEVAGEVDLSVTDLLAAALQEVTDQTPGLVWVDVGDLRFLDVAGARAMAHATRGYRSAGGKLVLLDARPPVRHVLRLMGVDVLAGMELLGAY